MCTLSKQVLFISKAYSGRRHDFAIFKDIFTNIDLRAYRLHVDASLVGIQKAAHCDYVWIPYKARKNQPLTKVQKAINGAFSSVRVVVENTIAKLKAFFILRIENRMRIKQKLDDAVQICAALANFKTTNPYCKILKIKL